MFLCLSLDFTSSQLRSKGLIPNVPLNLLEGLQILVANLDFYNDKRSALRLFDRLEDKSLIGMNKGEFSWWSYEYYHFSTKLDTVEAWRVYQADLAITAAIVLKLDPPCVSFYPLYLKFIQIGS